MNDDVLTVAWNLARNGKSMDCVDLKSFNSMCTVLIQGLNGSVIVSDKAPENQVTTEEWLNRVCRCPRTAGMLLSGLSMIISRNFKTLEAKFRVLINNLVCRYEELYSVQQEDDEGGSSEGEEKRKKKKPIKKKVVTMALNDEQAEQLAIACSPDAIVIQRRPDLQKLTQDMSWLNDPKLILDVTAVDSLIAQQLSQNTGGHESSGKLGALEENFKSLLGSIAQNEPFVVDEADDSFFAHFRAEADRAGERSVLRVDPTPVHMYEQYTPVPPQGNVTVEEVHMHERSAIRPGLRTDDFEMREKGTDEGAGGSKKKPSATKGPKKKPGLLKVTKAKADAETSVQLLDRPCLLDDEMVQQPPLMCAPSFWRFAEDFLASGTNILQSFIVRDRIALNCDAVDWSEVPSHRMSSAPETMRRDSVFSFAGGGAVQEPGSVLKTPNLPAITSAVEERTNVVESVVANTMSEALSLQCSSTGSSRAVALKKVLDAIFARSKEPVPWTCVLPPNAMRWQAAVCLGALLQLLAHGSCMIRQRKPFGELEILPSSLKRGWVAAEDDDDKENKRPRVVD